MGQRPDRHNLRCSFCGKSQDKVKRLVAGPGVSICNECIALCNQVMQQAPSPRPGPGRWQATHTGRQRGRARDWLARLLLRAQAAR